MIRESFKEEVTSEPDLEGSVRFVLQKSSPQDSSKQQFFFLVPFNYPWTDLRTLLEAHLLCKLNLSNPSPGLSPP